MSWFGRDKTEETVSEESSEPDLVECSECGEEFKETELNDDAVCKKCSEEQKMKKEKQSKMNYTFKTVYRSDENGNDLDNFERTHITKEDAQRCYELTKAALFEGKKYVEYPQMDTLDDDGDDSTYNIEVQSVEFVDNVSHKLDDDYEEDEDDDEE